mgnify:CR=1 FL=1
MGDLENKKDGLVGKAKEAYGDATGNEDVANEGKADPVSYTHLTLPTNREV